MPFSHHCIFILDARFFLAFAFCALSFLIDITVPDTDNDLLQTIFLAICLASTFFSLLSILVMGLGCNRLLNCKRVCGISANNWVSLLEVAMEDIPQVVITVMVSYRVGGPLAPQAVFNLTTSCMNFVLDLLDIADEFQDDRDESLENDDQVNGEAYASPY